MRAGNVGWAASVLVSVAVATAEWEGQATMRVLRSSLTVEQGGRDVALSGARVASDRLVDAEDITFCLRFNYKRLDTVFQGRAALIRIQDWRDQPGDATMNFFFMDASYPFSIIGFGHPEAAGSYKTFLLKDPKTGSTNIFATYRWIHYCVSFEKRSTHLLIVMDGRPLNVNYPNEELKGTVVPRDILNKTYLARCGFDFKNSCSTLEGEIADFNVWDRAFTVKEAEDWTTCRSLEKGNLLNWEEAPLELVNMTERRVSVDSICKPVRPGHVIFPLRRNFTSHLAICRKMRGLPSVVRDQRTQDWMIDEMAKHRTCGDPRDNYDGGFWAGYWDEPEEGVWTDVSTGRPLAKGDFTAWFAPHAEPNGDRLENCAVVWSARKAWNDYSCSWRYCTYCELERVPDVQIRGFCPGSKFDTQYSWTQFPMLDGRYTFSGYTDTRLFYVASLDQWRLQLYSNSSIYATVNQTEYPFGTLEWTVFNEPCYLDGPTKSVSLNINACNAFEFNCHDGSCVEIDQRCDGRVHCPDKSDEFDCKILTVDQTYLRSVPPPPLLDRESKASVSLNVSILSILDIVEVDNRFSLQFELAVTWFDRRVTMIDLHGDADLNTLTSGFRDQIWMPQVVFSNTNDKDETIGDDKAFVTIQRRGSYKVNLPSDLEIAHTYKGAENPIVMTRTYSTDFICEFDMSNYPFDTQLCSMVFVMKGNTGKFVRMLPAALRYLGPIDLTQYFVKDVSMNQTTLPSGAQAVAVDITFSRRVFSTVLTTYLPTFLLCMVCFSTNHFKAFFFEAIVTVNLTSMLVVTTFFVSISNTLPTTAYIKMIDIWLLFSLFIPFMEVLFHTFMDNLRVEVNRPINHHGRTVIPSVPSTAAEAPATPTSTSAEGNSNSAGRGEVKSQKEGKLIQVIPMEQQKSDSLERNVNLVDRAEQMEVLARRDYYAHAISVPTASDQRLMRWADRLASRGLPAAYLTFILCYFAVGLSR